MKKGVRTSKKIEFFKYNKLILLIIILGALLVGFVWAAGGLSVFVPNTLKGYEAATAFNATEDIAYTYNFTVNSSDAVAANITKVNITIPKGVDCYFINSTHGSNSGKMNSSGANTYNLNSSFFTNTTSVLTWINSSSTQTGSRSNWLVNASVNSTEFWFNTTCYTPGNYNITVNIIGYNGSVTISNETVFGVTVADATVPNLTVSFPANNSAYTQNWVSFNLTASDNYERGEGISRCWYSMNSGTDNHTMTNTSLTEYGATNRTIADNARKYRVRYWCNDTTGNTNTSFANQINFTLNQSADEEVTGDGSAVPGGSGKTYTNTYVVTEEQFKAGFTQTMAKDERAKVTINNVEHQVAIDEITSTTATVTVSSTPIEAVLSIGDERKFDVTGDGFYDMYVKLNSITSSKADVTLKSIYEKVTEETTLVEEEKQEAAEEQISSDKGESTSLTWVWIIIIVVIVLVGVGYWYKKKRG